jgi:hypothetical protein
LERSIGYFANRFTLSSDIIPFQSYAARMVPATAGAQAPGRTHVAGDENERCALRALRGDLEQVKTIAS